MFNRFVQVAFIIVHRLITPWISTFPIIQRWIDDIVSYYEPIYPDGVYECFRWPLFHLGIEDKAVQFEEEERELERMMIEIFAPFSFNDRPRIYFDIGHFTDAQCYRSLVTDFYRKSRAKVVIKHTISPYVNINHASDALRKVIDSIQLTTGTILGYEFRYHQTRVFVDTLQAANDLIDVLNEFHGLPAELGDNNLGIGYHAEEKALCDKFSRFNFD